LQLSKSFTLKLKPGSYTHTDKKPSWDAHVPVSSYSIYW